MPVQLPYIFYGNTDCASVASSLRMTLVARLNSYYIFFSAFFAFPAVNSYGLFKLRVTGTKIAYRNLCLA